VLAKDWLNITNTITCLCLSRPTRGEHYRISFFLKCPLYF